MGMFENPLPYLSSRLLPHGTLSPLPDNSGSCEIDRTDSPCDIPEPSIPPDNSLTRGCLYRRVWLIDTKLIW